MSRIPKPMAPASVQRKLPAAPVTRPMSELPPAEGYLKGEIERLPFGQVASGAEFPMLISGVAERGSVNDLLKLVRQESNDAASNAAKLATEAGGGGRHSLVRSINRARPLESLAGTELVGIVKNGEFRQIPVSFLAGEDGGNANTLGGELPSYYTNIVARLGYTPLDAASYTASDVLAKIKTVDGSGSGLDADLLDGQSSAYFLDWANFTGVPATFPPSAHSHSNAVAGGAAGFMSGTDKTKLDGISSGATANSPDATLLARANHTGTQAWSTITGTPTTTGGYGITDAAPLSHVGAGGAAHANAVASGAAGFMTGADKSKLDGVASGADVTGPAIAAATAKTTPVDADTVPISDSAASNGIKKVTWANIKATLKTNFDTLYALLPAAWTSMTVTASAFAGAIGTYSVTARRSSSGKSTDFVISFTITSIGTASQYLILTLPFTAQAGIPFALNAYRANDGTILLARMDGNTNTILLNGNGGTFPFASGNVIIISGRVETT